MFDQRLDGDPSDEQSTGIEITEIPHGRLLKPTGSIYKTTNQVISDMTDTELQDHILQFKSLVKEAEMNLDFRRVQLSMAQQEAETRVETIRRKMRNIKITPAGIKVALKPTTQNAFQTVVEKLKATGKSPAEIYEVLQSIQRAVNANMEKK